MNGRADRDPVAFEGAMSIVGSWEGIIPLDRSRRPKQFDEGSHQGSGASCITPGFG